MRQESDHITVSDGTCECDQGLEWRWAVWQTMMEDLQAAER